MAKTPKKPDRQPGIEAKKYPSASASWKPGPARVLLAYDDALFITGQVIDVSGGKVVNG